MLKKIAASTVAVISVSLLLTGCNGGKMSAAQTCTYINEQIAEQGLLLRADEISEELMTGDTSSYAVIMKDYASILSDAQAQTKDKKLAKNLTIVSERTSKAADLLAQGTSSNVFEISEQVDELDTDERTEAAGYLMDTCPDIQSFS